MSRDRGAAVTRWGRLLLPVAVAAVVLVASVSEPGGGPPAPPIFGLPADKLLHGGTYAAFAGALGVGLVTLETTERRPRRRLGRPLWRVAVLAAVGAVTYGLAMEGLQYPLPYRTFDLLDAAANAVGAAVGATGWLAGALVRRRFGR